MSSAESSMQPDRASANAEAMQDLSVRKSITVKAGVQRAFEVFTAGLDLWWPQTDHVGATQATLIAVAPRFGGR